MALLGLSALGGHANPPSEVRPNALTEVQGRTLQQRHDPVARARKALPEASRSTPAESTPSAESTEPTELSPSSFYRNLADLDLTDQHGRAVPLHALQGRLQLVNFFYTGCTTVCSGQTAALVALREALPPQVREAVGFLSVSLDPMGDIPPVLLDFARRHGADQAGWRFVGASPAAIDRLVQRLDLLDRRKAQPTLADHRTALWLVDRQGRLRQRYVGQPVDRARLAHELQALAALDRP